MKKLSRRALLRGAGGMAVSLPFLEAMLGRRTARADDHHPKRVIFFFTSCGVNPERWWPSGGENDFTLGSSLSPLQAHRSKLLIPDGVSMLSAKERSGGRNGHDVGVTHCLTGRPMVPGPSGFQDFGHALDGSAGGISIDQRIGRHFRGETPFESLVLGVDVRPVDMQAVRYVSYRDRFDPVVPIGSPGQAFDTIFGGITGGDPGADARHRRRQAVLDGVQGDLGRLRPRLAAGDQIRLDAHLASVRGLISNLDELREATCTPPDRRDSSNFPDVGGMHIDLIVNALKCDLTRVATLQWSTGQSGTQMTWLDRVYDGHHAVSHRGFSDGEGQRMSAAIDRWYAQRFALLLEKLDAEDMGDGTSLLDHTAVVWVNEQEQGIGNRHTWDRMPYIIGGSCGGAFRTGRYVQVTPGTPHNNLFVSLQNAMGISEGSFGDPDFCTGAISELA